MRSPSARLPRALRLGPVAWGCLLLIGLKLWLVAGQTLHTVAPSPHDDGLFLAAALSILRGEWLGTLTELTLVKGPVYPLWLAANHLAGAPLLLSQAVVYSAACAVFTRAARPALAAPWKQAVVFAVLLFNPASWADGPATRIAREGIYSSLSLALVGLAMGASLRLRSSPRRAQVWAAAAGLAGSLLAMTREDGVWLAPSLALVASVAIVLAGIASWRSMLAALATAAISYAIPVMAIAGLNWKHYGLFETCETTAGYFESAYGALTRVKAERWNPYVPVPRAARARLYAASPALAEVAPHLEESVPGWAAPGCSALGVCDDIAGGWFLWALRQAASEAGRYRSGEVARSWYEQVTREVDEACRSGRLACLASRSSLMPPMRIAYVGPLLLALGRATVFASRFSGITPWPSAAHANESDIDTLEWLTNEHVPRPTAHLEGILTSREGGVRAAVIDSDNTPAAASIRRAAVAPTPGTSKEEPLSMQFTVDTGCVSGCYLVLFTDARRTTLVRLSDGSPVAADAGLAWTTREVHHDVTSVPARRIAVLAVLTRAYSIASPVLLVLALAVLARRLTHALRARTFPVRSMLAGALLAGVVARIFMLALIDVTSFPAIIVLYMAPAYGLLIAFIALVLVGGADAPQSDAREVLRPSEPAPAA